MYARLTAKDNGELVNVLLDDDESGPSFTISKECKEWGSAPQDNCREWEKLCNKAGLEVDRAHIRLNDILRQANIEI